jgi:hypothetical protein
MAVLPAHPGLSVQVVVDDQPLPEYDDEDATQDDGSITKYIEACSGSEFKINLIYDKPFQKNKDLRVCCYIDGSLVSSLFFCGPHSITGKGYFIGELCRKEGAIWQRRKFHFQDLDVGTKNRFLYSSWKRETDSFSRSRIA